MNSQHKLEKTKMTMVDLEKRILALEEQQAKVKDLITLHNNGPDQEALPPGRSPFQD